MRVENDEEAICAQKSVAAMYDVWPSIRKTTNVRAYVHKNIIGGAFVRALSDV